jgi:hypothetical protein
MIVKLLFACVALASAPAFAQHDHAADEHHVGHHDGAQSHVSAGLAVVAASFDTMLYLGNYQGVLPSIGYAADRFSITATGSGYRIRENGAERYGAGDTSLHGAARLVTNDALDAGAMLMVSIPTGEERYGLGMGHVMIMPALYAAWRVAPRVQLAASGGYSRAVGVEGHHDHGAWPLVAPMLMAEVSWSAAGDVRISDRLSAGARASGGLPAGEGGSARASIGARVAWHGGRTDTAFELQAGVAGDPFTTRGVVATTRSF